MADDPIGCQECLVEPYLIAVREAGHVFVSAPGQGIILKSPNGTVCAQLTLSDLGKLVTTVVACP